MATTSYRTGRFFDALFEDDPEELYENAPCGYLSMLADGTIVKVNETFLLWFGYAAGELVGVRRLQELLPLGDRVFYETHFAPMLRLQGQVREIAAEITAADGTLLPVLLNAVTKFDDAGKPLVVRVAVFDARERRAYEAELLAARARAEESEAKARALAETLQASLLPPEPPSIPGLSVASIYRAAGDGSEVGGDFYDVFEMGSDTWGVVLGDVCGKGPTAAAVTALVRYSLRAATVTTRSPRRALRVAHNALLRQHPDTFCTAVCMTIDGAATATIAVGGHPRPVMRHADGIAERIGEFGSLLGMVPDHDSTETRVNVDPHDAVVLFTDGVLEARRGDEFFGERRLLDVIRAAGDDAHDIAHAVADAAMDFQSGTPRDDIAIVVVGRPAA